jgi:hypothetical protein
MANVYIEARPKGRPERSQIEDSSSRIMRTMCRARSTQHEAIDWAKKQDHTAHVARVRRLNEKAMPGHWRKV